MLLISRIGYPKDNELLFLIAEVTQLSETGDLNICPLLTHTTLKMKLIAILKKKKAVPLKGFR